MDVTVYLPDEIRQKAKDHGIVLSRFLRDALNTEFMRREATERALDGVKEVLLKLEDENGRMYRGRITATRLCESEEPEVYLTADEAVIVYEPDKCRYSVVQDAETELREWLREDTFYIAAMNALGITPTVDLVFGDR